MPHLPLDIFEAFEFYKAKGRLNEWNAALAEHLLKEAELCAHDILKQCLRRKAEWALEETKEEALRVKRQKDEMKRLEVRTNEAVAREKGRWV